MVTQNKTIMDSDNVVKKGYLVKSPPLTKVTSKAKRWCRRWFVFYDPTLTGDKKGKLVLYYFTNQESSKKETPKEIDLTDCEEIVDRKVPIHGFDHVIDVVTPKRTFHLCADTNKEKEEWLQTLKLRVFNEFTVFPEVNQNDVSEDSFKEVSTSPAPFEDWHNKLETLKRTSIPSSESDRTSSARGSSVFGDAELYSPMSFRITSSPVTSNGGRIERSLSTNVTRMSKISNGSNTSNTSTDDGIVVTPRDGRWSWDRTSSGSASINDEEGPCGVRMGFTGPKLVTDSSSLGGNSSPKQLHKCRSMNNLTDNLTRLATEYDARAIRPSSDSSSFREGGFQKRGSRCASLLEEFQHLARMRMNSSSKSEGRPRISESTDETLSGDDDAQSIVMV